MIKNNIVTFINQVILHLLSIGVYVYLTEIFPVDHPNSTYTNIIFIISICVIFFLYVISGLIMKLKHKWYKNLISVLASFPVTAYFLYLYYWSLDGIIVIIALSLVPMMFLWLVLQFKQVMYSLIQDSKAEKADESKRVVRS